MAGFKNLIDGVSIGAGNARQGASIGYSKQTGLSVSANFNRLVSSGPATQTQLDADTDLKALYNKSYNETNIVFPPDIDMDRYMMFKRTERVNDRSTDPTNAKVIQEIVLPLPQNLDTAHNIDYSTEPMGVLGGMMTGQVVNADFANAYTDIKNELSSGIDRFVENVENASGSEKGNINSMLTGIGGIAAVTGLASAFNIGAGAITAGLGIQSVIPGLFSRAGKAVNSHLAVLFNGVGFRTFQFNYRFAPRDEKESSTLYSLVQSLKEAMYPSLPADNKFLFEYPDEWNVEFCTKLKSSLFEFKRMVLKDMTVSYNGDGIPRFFEDGKPVVIDISMTFQEVEILTKEDFVWKSGMVSNVFNPTEDEAAAVQQEVGAF